MNRKNFSLTKRFVFILKEVFERYFEIDTIGNSNLNFKEEQERSVLSIFHQVKKIFFEIMISFSDRFLFHLFYDVEKMM
jgi:hypothetical protein